MPTGPADPALVAALEETGAIGSTVRQLAHRLDRTRDRVRTELERLQSNGEAAPIGRGLWILSSFATLSERDDFDDPAHYVERFAREGGVSLGTYRGPITFRSNEELPVHRWWPYVQGYSAEFVADWIARAELPEQASVLDPFAGSGTSLVEARRAGFRAIGHEILPPAALAARVKTTFETDPTGLVRAAEHVVRRARGSRPGAVPFLKETRRQFDPAVLRGLLRLRDALPGSAPGIPDALRTAFGATLIPVSRMRRSPCLGYGPPSEGPLEDPFAHFRAHVEQMAEDLRSLRGGRSRWGPSAKVVLGDARRIDHPTGSIAAAITSPPYVNGMDYVMNYKLDLAWLGYAKSYADLRALRHTMVACDNLPRTEAARYLRWDDAPDPWLREILSRIQRNVARKGSYRRMDAHGIVRRYFDDLAPVLSNVFRALRPGGRFALVVGDSLLAGVYVPGDLILARMGAAAGFRIDSVETARERRSGQRRSFRLRETIITLRKPGAGAP